MLVSCITRKAWSDLKTLEIKPTVGQGGGGVVTKYLNLRKCCPDMHFTNDFADPDMQHVIIVEPLCFFKNDLEVKEDWSSKIQKLRSHNKSVKLLWCEEQAVFRWKEKYRKEIFSAFDGLLACNAYQHQLLKVIAPTKPIYTLYTPIDNVLYQPREKRKQVLVAGKVGLQKNIDAILQLFTQLPADVHKLYIGNAGLWGKYAYAYDKTLETELEQVADEYVHSASPIETARRIGESLVGINMSIYDVGCLFFLECGMSGVNFFAWRYHPQFDEYENLTRFDTVEDGALEIMECLENRQQPNTALMKEIHEKHSFEAFREQLGHVLKEVLMNDRK